MLNDAGKFSLEVIFGSSGLSSACSIEN